jgi:Tfp pilus assembly protein PilX
MIKLSHMKKQNGFVILFAVLIASIILLIGVGMFRISVKESILSSTARESTKAFFAADSAIECALFADIKTDAFPTPLSPSIVSVSCDGNDYGVAGPSNGEYKFKVGFENGTCARVTIDKSLTPQVEITASGYNVCDGDEPDTEDPLLLERVLFVRYQFGS